ncbi:MULTISPECIES: hypothetical protein [Methylobacterium]|jgi:hypothetical protein|uniref:Uncharacterized protein n=3 Tax=Methylobacterium TaxID=407 RepID=A0AAE8L6J8_9HYPH|nr:MULTISPECIES: hypothetical protein [Methylobacterium]APT29655.1 hypothetical protein MCBMB27_00364 [Methylobacterium phyllosphaerae]MBA9062729.1 hypothetical protein [Methylobacterium fujisawaense]MDE4915747.1 hypothetical protein [Methylobacterium sp. 092160098-2]MDH3029450.1 hypothetical protein [Methylobacterium fujisawaense]RUP15143.1 MAG: hypothetical protein EKK43_08310 [Methylobacterium sp.]
MTATRGAPHRIWPIPAMIAAGTLISLVGALVADGIWDRLAALLLLVMSLYVLAAGLRLRENGR